MKMNGQRRVSRPVERWTAAFLACAGLIPVAGAGDVCAEDIQAESITVTATRHQEKVEDVSPSTEIVTREDIEAVSADTLEDAIRYSTSVYFYQDMMRSTPSIRGFEGKHTLILIDGKRYAGPEGKFDDPIRFTAGNIERIEVVRGPMSSLYGSEAMGGVINIITKRPEKNHLDADLRYGAYSHGDGAGSASFDIQLADPKREDLLRRVSLSLSGEKVVQDDMLLSDGTSLLSEDDTDSLTGNLEIRLNDGFRLEFDGGYNETDKEHHLFLREWLSRSVNEYASHDYSTGLFYEGERLNGMLRAYASHYEKDYEKRYTQGPRDGRISDFDEGERDTRVIEGKLDGLLSTPVGGHFVTLGGEYREEEYESVRISGGSPCGTVTRDGMTQMLGCYEPDSTAFYLQDEWMMGKRLTLVPAMRYDDFDNFGTEWSPKLGGIYRFHDLFRLKANYGHSFRAPGSGELFQDWYGMGGRYHIVGNPDLDPETSDAYDVALEGSGKTWFARIGYFYNDVDDLIDTQFAGTEGPPGPRQVQVYTYENIEKAVLQGFEVESSWQATKQLRLGLDYTYLDAEDDTTGRRLAGRPRHFAHAKLDYVYEPFDLTLNLRMRYLADYGYELADGMRNDSEFVTTVKLTKGINKYLDLYVGIDDLFDNYETYFEESSDDGVLERPGAFYYAGIKMQY